eukprot:IDg10209t1
MTPFRSDPALLTCQKILKKDQRFYLSKLKQLPLDRPLHRFPFYAHKACFKSVIKQLNSGVKDAFYNQVSLVIPKLDIATIHVVGYSDSLYANNFDFSTQIGHICFFCNDSGKSTLIYFKSYKSKRVVQSAMARVVIAFRDQFDIAATLYKELSVVLARKIAVQLLKDSKILFDVISEGFRTSKNRTILDIVTAREKFRDKVISDIGFVRSSQNLTD